MKKKDMIKQRNKLKKVERPKYMLYAQYACIILVVLFLIYTGLLSVILDESMQVLLSENLVIIIGFMICVANLYVWFLLKQLIKEMEALEHIESVRMNLIVMAIAQACLLNYISAILLLISLKKYFSWQTFSPIKALKEIKKDGQTSVLAVSVIVLGLLMTLVYMIYFAVS